MRRFFFCLALVGLRATATSITETSTFTITPSSGYASCADSSPSNSNCSTVDPSQLAMAFATAEAGAGSVSVAINGGAVLYGSTASASSHASTTDSFILTDGAGSGVLRYTVALTGFANGSPAEPASVLFNGASYSLLPNGLPAYYSFTQSFTYGQPFSITLSLDMTSHWDGSLGDGGSRSAAARLTDMSILSAPTAAALGGIPEPSTATMWAGGVLLILTGVRRGRKQR